MTYYKNINKNKIQFDFIIDSDSTVVPREEIERLGGRIIEVSPYQHIFSYIKDIRKVFKENKYKIVHAHMNVLSIFPLYAAWREKVSVRIAHSHSTTNKKEWKKNLMKVMLRPFSKLFATNYFACSEHAGRWLFGNKVFDEGKVTIIRNAINTEMFKYDENKRNTVRNKLNIDNKYVLGHVGRFVQQKNHTYLIDIFNEIHKVNKDTVLLLIGKGPLEDEIKDKVDKMKIKDSVLFLEQRDDVNELIQAMDCFIFPSLYEGLGIVVIEAQCSGLKCFCSKEVPKEANITELFEYCDLNNIGEWKEKILSNKKYIRRDYSDEIRKKEYEIFTETKKLEEIYEKIIKV